MIYDLRQTTVYAYASPVAYAHHVLRLTPINRMRQRVHAAALEVEPVPAERRDTIIAARDPSSAIYRIDFRIQGTRETVFFDL